MTKGVQGRLSNDIKVDKASFYDIIKEAKKDSLLINEEDNKLNKLREIRNSLVHPKDIKFHKNYKLKQSNDFFHQYLKLTFQSDDNIEKDAKFSITLLYREFPKISLRIWGLAYKK